MPANLHSPLVRREALGGPYALLTFRHPQVATEASPGQFVMIKAGLSSEPPLRRPFSIMEVDPGEDSFTLFVKAVGPGSSGLAALAAGDPTLCLGPLGRGFEACPPERQALFVAGGYGIAPMLFLARRWPEGARRPKVFFGARTAADIQLADRFEGVAELIITTEDGSLGSTGRVTEPLSKELDRGEPAALFGCGPDAMLHALARLGARHGVPCQVSLDPWMGCGVGTCLSCVVRIQGEGEQRPHYRCACTQGPVFDAHQVVWPEAPA